MRVLRGRADDVETDRTKTREMTVRVSETGERALRVWRPHRQVAFGRRDVREDGYERAREACTERGFPAVERRVGGRAVAYTGSTVAFARAEPVADIRSGLQDRYAAATTDLQVALRRLGVATYPGEPPDSFCPGTHSLRTRGAGGNEGDEGENGSEGEESEGGERGESESGPGSGTGGKVVGIAQRVGRGAALVAGVVVIDSAAEIAAVLEPVYDALGIAFDPDSVGSVEGAGGETGRKEVLGTIERTLVGEASDVEIERIDE